MRPRFFCTLTVIISRMHSTNLDRYGRFGLMCELFECISIVYISGNIYSVRLQSLIRVRI